MSNVTYLKPRIKSDQVLTVTPESGFTLGRCQPPKNDKHYQPLEGIHSELDFRGAKIDKPVIVVKDANGIKKIFKQNNISVVEDHEAATVYETSEIDGVKVSKVIEVIPRGKQLKGYYLTTVKTLVRPIQKVSIESRQPDRLESDPDRLEQIALDYEQAGNQPMAKLFADRAVDAWLDPNLPLENIDHLLVDGDDLVVEPLGLSYVSNCHKQPLKNRKKPAKRGSKGITTKQRRLIRNTCFLLEKQYGKNCLSMGCSTLPAFSDRRELELICANWSDIKRQFFQALGRLLEDRGYPTEMVWVTEIQEDRYRETGDVCPHLHWVMVGKKNRYQKGYAIHCSEVRSIWERILSNFLGRSVTCQAGTRLERPRKSLCAELGKYMSKGGKVIQEIIEDGKAHMLPSSYGGASDKLKELYTSKTINIRDHKAGKFVDNLERMKQAGWLFYKPITIYSENLGREITIGYVGWIKDREKVFNFLESKELVCEFLAA